MSVSDDIRATIADSEQLDELMALYHRRDELRRDVIGASVLWYGEVEAKGICYTPSQLSCLLPLWSAVKDLLAFEQSINANAPADQARALTFTHQAKQEPSE